MTVHLAETRVAVLAGGMGTRLGDLTESLPKSLVPVEGEPFLTHQLRMLYRQGIRHAVVCVGRFGTMISDQFGQLAEGIRLEYSFDGAMPLGTGGSIVKAMPMLGEIFFVLYGDSYLEVDFAAVADLLRRRKSQGLMTVFRNEGRFDVSNVSVAGEKITDYRKVSGNEDFSYIDYGLSMFSRQAFSDAPPNTTFDLSEVFLKLIRLGQLDYFEATRRFYEIGSPAGLEEFRRICSQKTAPPKSRRKSQANPQ
jgi:NDP-sugar pyrophosphorylase family protein